MKNIIDESVLILGAGPVIYLSKIESNQGNTLRLMDLSMLSGRKIQVRFSYTEGENTTVQRDKTNLVVPENLDKQGVKDYILTSITQ